MNSKYLALSVVICTAAWGNNSFAEQDTSVEALQERIETLEKTLNERLEIMADEMESASKPQRNSRVTLGGYGELHYNRWDEDGEDFREIDLHRVVIFFGYEFSDRARFISELEVEHAYVSANSRGSVEVEQAYIELDLKQNLHWKTGVLLMPLGIISETHEPTTFYGVERPVIETTIIPTTWYSAGTSIKQNFESGFSYDLMISEGLKTEDPTSDPDAEPFNLKAGKQKASFAAAYDLALTARLAYRGIRGLELSAYTQYQPDLDQSAENSYADSATLLGGHVIYSLGSVTAKVLYANWSLAGDEAAAAGKDAQAGGYLELSWKPSEKWGIFSRYNAWSQHVDEDKQQTDFGVNFYPLENVVFKADYFVQNEDAGNVSGFNLGMGYQF
ncbi:hypothetical protein P886_2524 [Alteromonadaceae bacterium 2753L.S.0a.02]|nr:hypothetical protein P886_2524 [Alteromonadaceae bacterium 2753L.S.0a.02]